MESALNQLMSEADVPKHVPPELVIDFDYIDDPGLAEDAFSRLRDVRDNSPPIAYTFRNGGRWLLFRHDDMQTLLSDSEHFSSGHFATAFSQVGAPPLVPLGLDPPDHFRWRMILLNQLGPKKIRTMEKVIRQKAEELILPLAKADSCDFVQAVAEPMPITIFMETMGLPLERFREFRELALQIVSPPEAGEVRDIGATNTRIIEILEELIAERKKAPKHDLVSALIAEEVDGEPISGQKVLELCYILFLGGLDTVTNAMSFGIRHLAINQDMQDEVRRHPERMDEVVEKLLRLTSFVNPTRVVRQDTSVLGVPMKKGEIVLNVAWAGSNEAGGETEGSRHMAFGGGHHLCAGMHLARLELRIMFETWFKHIGRFTLAPDKGPTMHGGTVFHLKRLLLRLEPLEALVES